MVRILPNHQILIVEDNPRFREGARKYLITREGIQISYATDYNEAIREVYSEPRLGGALIDCFFPKVFGSGDLTLGYEAIQRMIESHPGKRKTSPVTKDLTQVGDLLGEDFAKIAAKNAGVKYESNIDHFWAMEQAMKIK